LRKRPIDPERVERMVNGIVRRLESHGEGDVHSVRIGELVMEGLRALDPNALTPMEALLLLAELKKELARA
jgi:transcriptional repressor NrdR